ncbi:hypothetical protein U1Q18_000235 [Sarracenia purpurea var. burkii]
MRREVRNGDCGEEERRRRGSNRKPVERAERKDESPDCGEGERRRGRSNRKPMEWAESKRKLLAEDSSFRLARSTSFRRLYAPFPFSPKASTYLSCTTATGEVSSITTSVPNSVPITVSTPPAVTIVPYLPAANDDHDLISLPDANTTTAQLADVGLHV